jgi:lysozyme
MKTSQAGINMIKAFEGLAKLRKDGKIEAYKDPIGVLTIGYGHTKYVNDGLVITEQQANQFLKSDLRRFEEGVNDLVAVDITQNQYDSLVSFAFNVGLLAFDKSTLLRKLNEKDYNGAASQFIRWNKAGGNTLAGLTIRRIKESQNFKTGIIS